MKKAKSETSAQRLFCSSRHRGSAHLAVRVGPPGSLPENTSCIWAAQATLALNCVCEHLYFHRISFAHLLARCVLWNCFFALHPLSL